MGFYQNYEKHKQELLAKGRKDERLAENLALADGFKQIRQEAHFILGEKCYFAGDVANMFMCTGAKKDRELVKNLLLGCEEIIYALSENNPNGIDFFDYLNQHNDEMTFYRASDVLRIMKNRRLISEDSDAASLDALLCAVV